MPTAFLLRFQEFCDECPSRAVQAGTATSTRVRAEQSDADPGVMIRSTLPRSAEAGGTMTKTSIDRETDGKDADRAMAQMRAVPWPIPVPVAGTKTVTNVRAEADDSDPRRASLNAIPTCS